MKLKITLLFLHFALLNAIGQSIKTNIYDIARNGTVENLHTLIQTNPKIIDSIDARGYSPLIIACYKGNSDVAKFLISKSKTINFASENGTALAASIMSGKIDIAQQLLQFGANPNISDELGVTPLMHAIEFQKVDFIKLLLLNGALIKVNDKTGKSIFEYATQTKKEEIINLFINK